MWTLCECCWKRKAIKIQWISGAEVPSPRCFEEEKISLEVETPSGSVGLGMFGRGGGLDLDVRVGWFCVCFLVV